MTDTYATTTYEPLAGEPAYTPAPAYDAPAGTGYDQPAGGGFRTPEEQYGGQAYPTGDPYPATPPVEPGYPEQQRGWNP